MDRIEPRKYFDQALRGAARCASYLQNPRLAFGDLLRRRGQCGHRASGHDDRTMSVGVDDIARANAHAKNVDFAAEVDDVRISV
jgi:hypothetical protein